MLQLTNVSKVFHDRSHGNRSIVHAVDHVSLDLPEGKLYSLLGPSGCGKSTTLRAIAGLETPDSGTIVVGGRTFFDSDKRINLAPHRRKLGMVFQSYSIWPHMTVFGNVAFPLTGFGMRKRSEIERRVDRVLDLVQLGEMRDRPATKLSGGQQQRLALARALVVEPPLLLLDEPLSNLDLKLRINMRMELRRMQRELNITTLFVTHDQTEALGLSDVVAVMNEGKIVQAGSPRDIYGSPNNMFVADFVGAISFLRGVVDRVETQNQYVVELPQGTVTVGSERVLAQGSNVTIGVRPESVYLEPGDFDVTKQPNVLYGHVEGSQFVGGAVEVRVRVGDAVLRAKCSAATRVDPGDSVRVRLRTEGCAVITE